MDCARLHNEPQYHPHRIYYPLPEVSAGRLAAAWWLNQLGNTGRGKTTNNIFFSEMVLHYYILYCDEGLSIAEGNVRCLLI